MSKISYGVVVGRFQVHELHKGHRSLLDQVGQLHQRVIVFLGVAPTGPTSRNPMDFETRRLMIQADYPNYVVLPILDCADDGVWSKALDHAIANVAQMGTVTLYGGRDSFTPHYSGKHTVKELFLPRGSHSGEQVRDRIANSVMQSPDFRAGAIYTMQNMYPRCVPTVDVAIISPRGDHLLLGRKTGETGWRFIGGHVEPGDTLEDRATDEAHEEVCALIPRGEWRYIGSCPIHDWRWAKEPDAGVVTSLFVTHAKDAKCKAGDDMAEADWHQITTLKAGDFVRAHQALWTMFKTWYDTI